MKIGLISKSRMLEAFIKHGNNCHIGTVRDDAGVIVDNPLEEVPTGIPIGNTSLAVKNLIGNSEAMATFRGLLGLSELEQTVSYIFALFNGTQFSEFLEISFSTKFMNHEVGPQVGFTTGIATKCTNEIYVAVPQLNKFQDILSKQLKYSGEVLFGLAQDYTISNVTFGHSYGPFGLFIESCREGFENCLHFMLGQAENCTLYTSCALANLVSLLPFPVFAIGKPERIEYPSSAEKHIWKFPFANSEVALITVHGQYSIGEARARLRRTIENMLRYREDLQFRTDYGVNPKPMLLCQEQLQKYLTWKREPEPKESLAVKLDSPEKVSL